MKRAARVFAAGVALALTAQSAPPPPGPPPAAAAVELRRIDCGQLVDQDLASFSDTFALDGRKATLVVPCYLIRHGNDWMLWDTGISRRFYGARPTPPDGATLAQPVEMALAQLNLKPSDITRVGVSHYHWDHSGQLPIFAAATLLIGKADWDAVRATDKRPGLERSYFQPWTSGKGKVTPVAGDLDVFGDGSVVMLDLPGHTPGHHGLLVRLAKKGAVLLSGDLAHTSENYRDNGVPTFNANRADSLASLDRFKAIARNLGATVILEHVADDVDKLPRWPEAAR